MIRKRSHFNCNLFKLFKLIVFSFSLFNHCQVKTSKTSSLMKQLTPDFFFSFSLGDDGLHFMLIFILNDERYYLCFDHISCCFIQTDET